MTTPKKMVDLRMTDIGKTVRWSGDEFNRMRGVLHSVTFGSGGYTLQVGPQNLSNLAEDDTIEVE